jgi:hypothetical protein
VRLGDLMRLAAGAVGMACQAQKLADSLNLAATSRAWRMKLSRRISAEL